MVKFYVDKFVGMTKVTATYKDFIEAHISKEILDPLPEGVSITLENKSGNTVDFDERDLRFVMQHYKASEMILQCQKCRKLINLQYNLREDSIIVYEKDNMFYICPCNNISIGKRYKTRTEQVRSAFRNFNSNETM